MIVIYLKCGVKHKVVVIIADFNATQAMASENPRNLSRIIFMVFSHYCLKSVQNYDDHAILRLREDLNNNDRNQIADQRFSLKPWFPWILAGSEKTTSAHCYLRISWIA